MPQRKRYRFIIIAVVVFAVLSFSDKYFFYDYSSRLIGDLLFEIAQIRGNQNYTIKNKQVSFFPLERQLLIKNLEITPNDDSLASNMRYEVEIPELFVDIESLSEIYFYKKLTISGLRLKKPTLRIKKLRTDTTKSQSFILNANDLYERASRYLTDLQVESFLLDSGNMEFEDEINDIYQLQNFTIAIEKFSMDSAHMRSNQNPFFTENVSLRLSEQEFTLRDHNHRISFDSLLFSSGDSSFVIHNLVYKNISSHDKQDSVNISKVSFTKMDVNAFYTENTIDLGKIHLLQPYLHLHPPDDNNRNKKKQFVQNDSRYTFRLDSIWFTKGSLAYNHNDFLFNSEDLNLHHGSYVLYPGAPLVSFGQLIHNISMNGKELHLKSESLNFSLSSIEMDTEKDFLTIRDVSLQQNNKEGKLDLKAKLARISKFEIHNRDYYEIDTLLIEHPDVILTRKKTRRKDKSLKSDKFIVINYLNAVSGSLYGVLGENIIDMQEIDIVGKSINSQKGLNNVKNIKIIGKEYNLNLNGDKINGKEWCYNGMNNLVATKKVISKYGNISEVLLYDPYLEGLSQKNYRFDSLIIKNADISLAGSRKNSGKLDKESNTVDYGKIRIEKSKLGWKSDGEELKINSIDLTLLSNEVIAELFVQGVTGFQEDLAFSVEEPHYDSTKRRLTVKNIRLSEGDRLSVLLDSVHLDNFPGSMIGYTTDSLSKVIRRITFFQPDIKSKLAGGSNDQLPSEDGLALPPLSIVNGTGTIKLKAGSSDEISVFVDSINFTTNERSEIDEWPVALKKGQIELGNIRVLTPTDSIFVQKTQLINNRLLVSRLDASLKNPGDISFETASIVNPGFEKLSENQLIMDSLITEGLRISIKKDRKKASTSTSLQRFSLPYFTSRQGNVDFYYKDQKINLPGLDVTISHLNWSPDQVLDSVLARAQFEIKGQSLSYDFTDIQTSFKTGFYTYSDTDKALTIENFRSSPTINKDEFMDNKVVEADWINGSVDKVVLEDFDFRDPVFHNSLDVGKISLLDMSMYVYRDKRLPDPKSYKPLPHSRLMQLPVNVSIDTIFVESNRITYVEKNSVSDYLGRLFFSDIEGYILNIYSDKEAIRQHPRMTLLANGKIMNEGFFETEVQFVTIDTSGAFTMQGSVGNMDLTSLNPILENSAQVSVNSGVSKRIDFSFEANNQYALGDMRFYYDDLKVSVFNKDNLPKGLGASLKTFFANTFIVNKRNPHFLFVREGDIFFERLEERSIINYWAKSLLSGVVSSIGARNNKKEIRQLNQETKKRLESLSD